MKIAALIIGIFGAVAGFIGSLLAIIFGGIGAGLGVEEGEQVIGLGFGALLMSVIALVGAALAIGKPKVSAGLMAISAVVGVILVSAAYVLATVLLLIAALLAFLGRRSGAGGPSDT